MTDAKLFKICFSNLNSLSSEKSQHIGKSVLQCCLGEEGSSVGALHEQAKRPVNLAFMKMKLRLAAKLRNIGTYILGVKGWCGYKTV